MSHKQLHKKLIVAEVILVVASVLIWRSLWLLLDGIAIAKEPIALVIALILGFLLLIPSLRYIIDREH